MNLDRNIYLERYGDPKTWFSDCSARPGNYLTKDTQRVVHERLNANQKLIAGMSIRLHTSEVIAAVLGVSRIAVNNRRRQMGLQLPRGQGKRRIVACLT